MNEYQKSLMGLVICALSCVVGCAQQKAASTTHAAVHGQYEIAEPDPSVRISIRPSEKLVENAMLLAGDGVVRAYDIRGTSNHLILTFEKRTAAPEHKDLAAYSAWGDAMLKEREIKTANLKFARNPIKDAGLPFVAKTYVNVVKPGTAAPNAICDAAGLRFETPGGFWTISWNADLGQIDKSMWIAEELLGKMDIARVP